ncbi:MAG: hypothetical protein MI749_05705 [Desulfovibrionales bacterium]|nr:hypothetical protein [Desulfovibrionales bacterium]
MIDKFTAIIAWATSLTFVPKFLISSVIISIALLLLFFLWSTQQKTAVNKNLFPQKTQPIDNYTVSVTSFELMHNMEHRLAVIAAISSTGYKVRDDGKAWKNPKEAWENWYSSVYPKLASSVIDNTDIFILHRGAPEQAKSVQESINAIYPNAIVQILRHGNSSTPNISVYLCSKNNGRFKIE